MERGGEDGDGENGQDGFDPCAGVKIYMRED